VLASCLNEHHPDRESIKAILYKAFFADSQDKWSALLPDNIWFNAGIRKLFSSLQHPTQVSHIIHRSVPLFTKGIIERFFLHVQNAYILACSPGEDSSGKHFIARRVVKDGIHYRKNRYWHSDLARYMGKEVHIRKESTQISPETLEVFFEQQWICSASLLKATNENDVQEAE
ncbi:MAG TPA: Mu transposase C-terminal domain-containing protein, partial [Ktedonobacteraceae bacterium]|nr:Mu transposase C-terminal domain-containing protein [Ktedonobacteraceae bacterium]